MRWYRVSVVMWWWMRQRVEWDVLLMYAMKVRLGAEGSWRDGGGVLGKWGLLAAYRKVRLARCKGQDGLLIITTPALLLIASFQRARWDDDWGLCVHEDTRNFCIHRL